MYFLSRILCFVLYLFLSFALLFRFLEDFMLLSLITDGKSLRLFPPQSQTIFLHKKTSCSLEASCFRNFLLFYFVLLTFLFIDFLFYWLSLSLVFVFIGLSWLCFAHLKGICLNFTIFPIRPCFSPAHWKFTCFPSVLLTRSSLPLQQLIFFLLPSACQMLADKSN